ncbi:Tetratricopeptide-like helical [Corchorus olitorius]|uniref:Tetratricopeptide-like helical n=1 Tax=Corchorus olitorius TaxID=93759 RepID=A0A1R3J3J1_9ROSI|nr:Tetratricopeptide-like helical [Corchorus olitorius]
MGQCYESEQLHKLEEAIKCYKRAANSNDAEAIAMHRLAKLHIELGQPEEAALYYRKDLKRMEAEKREGPNYRVEALMFLAQHYKAQKRFEEAEERETGKSLLREMRIAQSGFPSMDVEHFHP